MAERRICSIDGCGKAVRCRHLCEGHYRSARKKGLPVQPHAKKGDGQAFVDSAHALNVETCILWPFTSRDGYGTMRIDGRHIQPHRYACMLKNGPPALGNVARHTCNVKRCVNPNHMLWGTDQDNADDKVRAGTCAQGENIATSKLTEKSVLAIRASKSTHVALAKRYRVSVQTVMNIRARYTWKHI